MRVRTDETGHVFRALTIAGSDSGGGAGIQADLKTMHQFGVYGMSVVTALTAQNTTGVHGVMEAPPEFVAAQLQAVIDDLGVDAMKTGMLANEAIIATVADVLSTAATVSRPLVIDPVMVAKGGTKLIDDSAIATLRERLLPMAALVTPNAPETGVLVGASVDSWDSVHLAAERLAQWGSDAVVVKGGHLDLDVAHAEGWRLPAASNQMVAVDTVYAQGTFTYFLTPRVNSANTHGTGCTFSAAITALLAGGAPVLDAIAQAKAFIYDAIVRAKDWDVGHGHGPTDHSTPIPVAMSGVTPGGSYYYDGRNWTRVD
ncbi:bifunctional hydroxymethylpyrimidine kinase/phosphomethylpyrimidine kinase [Alicyclobacillus acidoterrestris]|uniref:Hydroxymethylpyrimidine/phosphomethylpyrimidine kinase n=1 Tax=Alicyclobacillus acidoterrestris (strain ATCC 49025 / DSM 3922 / CIP 106132 / NCIMB 13137 / GD3B) TaxID=1356854 RepID=A0A9E6ZXE7_ALIAG|nr:bifunctional hydroxymethylpyrimidine kinase/phosphomethylpyrimidine kinase [Alicyclobacillus acidoterrestris]UNO50929.1 bifunctional hydroxymethylpyrimidine kinase/phosphomethylpyrimidine kinase [Alicyclobacillus acidoterrestris]